MPTEETPIQLQDFVKEVLVQIVKGVREAQQAIGLTDASINPIIPSKNSTELTRVNMDVAVVATGSKEKSSGIGVATVLNAGMKENRQTETSTTSRVQFDVTVRLPTTDTPAKGRRITKKMRM